jgi:hypothetical protein
MRRKTDTSATTTDPNPPGSADFRSIFNTNNQPDPAAAGTATTSVTTATATPGSAGVAVTPAPTAFPMAPTAQSLFGDNPWCIDAGGTGPQGAYSFNPVFFATPATAAKVAQMLGGKVVATDSITPFGPFKQNQPNLMVQMPDGKLINAGLIAGLYSHGYSQVTVDQLISQEVNGA